MPIPMSSPDLTAAESEAVVAALQSRTLGSGPCVEAFEAGLAAYVGVGHAAAVSSGTSALHLAIVAAGIGDGDLVITSPFSFVASSNVLLYERAIPIFVDVDPLTKNIDAALVEEAASDLEAGGERARRWLPPCLQPARASAPSRLKAVLPIHCFGQPADMNELSETARAHRLAVIEDACEAIGAEHEGRRVGTFGDAAAFAFYPNKQMTTGEGGMLVTARSDWDATVRSLRNQGRDAGDPPLMHARLGYNYRLDEMRAALGLVQVQRLDELLAKRARVAGWYEEALAPCTPWLDPPFIAPSTTRMSWFAYVVTLHDDVDRDALMRDLEASGIASRPYFPPIHLYPFYRRRFGYEPGDFPWAEDLGRRCLALPFSGVMDEEQVNVVTSALASAVRRHRKSAVAAAVATRQRR